MNVPRAMSLICQALGSRFMAGVAVLFFVFIVQWAGSPAAMAFGDHDPGHSVTSASVNHRHDHAGGVTAVFKPLIQSLIAPATLSAGCGDHDRHQPGSDTKSCCAAACCAVALVWQMATTSDIMGRVVPKWLFCQQFLLLDPASGLDRPPDFRA